MILEQACLKDQDSVVLSKWDEILLSGFSEGTGEEKDHVPLCFSFLMKINNVR